MKKRKASNIKTPSDPRSLSDWEAGTWKNAPSNKIKYDYCRSGPESLRTIARKLSGKATPDPTKSYYQEHMTKQDIVKLNFGTVNRGEINWYMERFNGCGKRLTRNGENYLPSRHDDRPWLWIPTIMTIPGITITIGKKGKAAVKMPPPHDEFSQAIIDRFNDININKDGELSREELKTAIGKSSFSGIHAAMVATLKRWYDFFGMFEPDHKLTPIPHGGNIIVEDDPHFTLADVAEYDRRRLKNPRNGSVLALLSTFNDMKTKLASINKKPFVGEPDPFSVQQGAIGDCYLLAAICGLANIPSRRGKIRSMIRELPGYIFEVKFPGCSSAVTFPGPTDGELLNYSSAGGNGLWLSILEKAYYERLNQQAWIFTKDSPYDKASIITAVLENFAGSAIKMITGNSAHSYMLFNIENLPYSSDYGITVQEYFVPLNIRRLNILRSLLTQAFGNKKIVTGGVTLYEWPRQFLRKTFLGKNGLPVAHAYTVVAFDRNRDTLRIRNPWGHMPENKDSYPKSWKVQDGGIFELSLDQFYENFTSMAIEQ